MIRYYYKKALEPIQQIDRLQAGCWINISPPFNQEELRILSSQLDIPPDYFIDSLDIDESSRYETEDGVQLIVLNAPLKTETYKQFEATYITIPVGLVEIQDYIITLSAYENPVIEFFINRPPRKFDTTNHSDFVLQIFDKTAYFFLQYLKNINNKRNVFEKELYLSGRNEELAKLMDLQKSLVYFVTNLRGNELMMRKMQRTDFLKIRHIEGANDLFEDIIIDVGQAQEMAQIYTDIMNNTMQSLASIISNNLNDVMKRLTSITIILMVPTLVASFYGMNVPLVGEQNPNMFWILLLFSVTIALLVFLFFSRKRFF